MIVLLLQEVSVSLWAVAKLGFHPGRMLVDFGARIEELINEFVPQACSNTLWALAVLQVSEMSFLSEESRHYFSTGVLGGRMPRPCRLTLPCPAQECKPLVCMQRCLLLQACSCTSMHASWHIHLLSSSDGWHQNANLPEARHYCSLRARHLWWGCSMSGA